MKNRAVIFTVAIIAAAIVISSIIVRILDEPAGNFTATGSGGIESTSTAAMTIPASTEEPYSDVSATGIIMPATTAADARSVTIPEPVIDGPAIGNVYSSDLTADIDGMEINSYVINDMTGDDAINNGQHAIAVSDLKNYGFSINMDNYQDSHDFVLYNAALPNLLPTYVSQQYADNTLLGTLYKSRINVSVNEHGLESYVLKKNDGSTLLLVTVEGLGTGLTKYHVYYDYDLTLFGNDNIGYSYYLMKCNVDRENKTISLHVLRPGMTIPSDIGDVVFYDILYSVCEHDIFAGFGLVITGKPSTERSNAFPQGNSYPTTHCDFDYIRGNGSYYSLNDLFTYFGIGCFYSDNTLTVTSNYDNSREWKVESHFDLTGEAGFGKAMYATRLLFDMEIKYNDIDFTAQCYNEDGVVYINVSDLSPLIDPALLAQMQGPDNENPSYSTAQ